MHATLRHHREAGSCCGPSQRRGRNRPRTHRAPGGTRSFGSSTLTSLDVLVVAPAAAFKTPATTGPPKRRAPDADASLDNPSGQRLRCRHHGPRSSSAGIVCCSRSRTSSTTTTSTASGSSVDSTGPLSRPAGPAHHAGGGDAVLRRHHLGDRAVGARTGSAGQGSEGDPRGCAALLSRRRVPASLPSTRLHGGRARRVNASSTPPGSSFARRRPHDALCRLRPRLAALSEVSSGHWTSRPS